MLIVRAANCVPVPSPSFTVKKAFGSAAAAVCESVRLARLFASLAPPAKKIRETAAIEELRTRGGIARTEGGDHRGEKMLEGGALDRDPRRPGQDREGVELDLAFGRRQPGFERLVDP